ncbi:MAG: RNA 2',3'-cyclic phosphodiesterase [Phycisphaerae bacterium]
MRLFVAITLDEAVRNALGKVQNELRSRCEGVRWVPVHQLHMTVKFLGDVPDRDVAGVSRAVAAAAEESKPFRLKIEGCGCFPERGSVRIVWAGADEPTGALTQCVHAVEHKLEVAGFPRERRPFSPHLTIGRVREDRSYGRIRAAVDAHAFAANEQSVASLVLMSSVLSPKGPTYTPVSTANLGERSPENG